VTFGPVSDFFRENSYQQTWLTGDVFGWFTIAENSTSCDTSAIATQAQAGPPPGVNLAGYAHLVYAFLRTMPAAGASFVGAPRRRGSTGA
jgi:hypothetical protein